MALCGFPVDLELDVTPTPESHRFGRWMNGFLGRSSDLRRSVGTSETIIALTLAQQEELNPTEFAYPDLPGLEPIYARENYLTREPVPGTGIFTQMPLAPLSGIQGREFNITPLPPSNPSFWIHPL